MEIRDDSKIKVQWYAELATREKKMPKKDGQEKRSDQVEIKSKIAHNMKNAPEVRKDKVQEARENIIAGKYSDSKVMDEIVDRLIEQFGL